MLVAKIFVLLPCVVCTSAGWRMAERAAPDETMTVHLMLRHSPSAIETLERTLVAVSDPTAALYGEHLSLEQLSALVPVDEKHKLAVSVWLAAETGVSEVLPNHDGDIVAVTLTASTAERLFATRIHRFHHPSTGDGVLLRATSPYSLPQPVVSAVAAVADLVGLPNVDASIRDIPTVSPGTTSKLPNSCSLLGCTGKLTPGVLKERYKIPDDSTGMTAAGNSMAIAEFCPLGSPPLGTQCQYFSPKDVAAFSEKCHVNATVDNVIGPNLPGVPWGSGIEALLDIEFTRGLADAIPLTVIFQSKYSIAAWVHTLSSLKKPPLVHSISWGSDEFQNGTDKGDSDIGYMQSINVQFMKAGVRGVSILVASGDSGVCAFEGCGTFNKRYHAVFPASSPYITSVGGTEFTQVQKVGDEKVWPSGGGGFSDAFAVGDFQREAVATYKANPTAKLPAAKLWNATGRGYPDVSALAVDYCEIGTAGALGVSGTSAAAPVTAAVFARLNGLRLAAGKSPLGWLNPFIYQNGDAFNDVTQGRNGGNVFSKDGFTATKGWDPASGWGTPNFEALAKRVSAAASSVTLV